MLSDSKRTIYFNKTNVIEISVIKINMCTVSYYRRIIIVFMNISLWGSVLGGKEE